MHWYFGVLRKYAMFEGRARRKEYWVFALVNLIVSIITFTIDRAIDQPMNIIITLYSLAVFLPSLAVLVRRLHDTDRSGWWVLISLVPLIGSIVLLIFTLQNSDPHENRYGPSPK